jgi:HAD superfamily hydrolase (TIGR01549 family)
VLEHIPEIDAFYLGEFENVRKTTSCTPLAREAVRLAKEKAGKVVLATNPYFPDVAVRTRLEWAGLNWEDFDLVTFYDNSTRCKPNPEYYVEIAEKMGVNPEKCLMVGNNAKEDIKASQAVGLDTFLITDCLIATIEIPETKKGSFEELIEFLKNI